MRFKKYLVNPFSEAKEWVRDEFKRISDYLYDLTTRIDKAFDDFAVYEWTALSTNAGNISQSVNAMDWTGHLHADGTALYIRNEDVVSFGHETDAIYRWVGPKEVQLGVGGDYISTEDDYQITGTVDHRVLTERDALDSHPIGAITGLITEQARQDQDLTDHENAYNPHQKVNWIYPYVLGDTYHEDDMVNDGGWLEIANKTTIERAAPQPVGEQSWIVPDAPIYTDEQYLGGVQVGVRITNLSLAYQITKVRVWVPNISADAHYRLLSEDLLTEKVTLGTEFDGDALDAPGWFEHIVNPEFVVPGDDLHIYFQMSNSAANQEYNHPWLYQGVSNQDVDPGVGNTTRRGDHTRLLISSTDDDAVNRDAELGNVIVGSTISITAEANASRFSKYEAIGARTDQTGWWLFEVALVDTGVLGEPIVGERCQNYFVNPVHATTDYIETIDEYVDNPVLTGRLYLGDDPVIENNNFYGVDILVQQYTSSKDWDNAASPGSASGGEAGGLEPHTLGYHSDVNAPAPTNGDRLAWNDVDGEWEPKRSLSALGFAELDYRMTLPLNTTPNSGYVSRGADPVTVTTLYFNKLDTGSNDLAFFFQWADAGDWMNLHLNSDTDIEENYDLTGAPVLVGDIWEVPVTYHAHAGIALKNNDRLRVLMRYVAPELLDSIWVGETPPNPNSYQQWFDSKTGVQSTWYVDSDGGQWVAI